jgi:hypothetical protein
MAAAGTIPGRHARPLLVPGYRQAGGVQYAYGLHSSSGIGHVLDARWDDRGALPEAALRVDWSGGDSGAVRTAVR